MGTFRETREVERELANDYGFDADRMIEVDEGDSELRDMTRDSRSNASYGVCRHFKPKEGGDD